MSGVMVDLAWALCSYLVGALPTGYFVSRYAGVADITQHGSGTMGATNVARMLGVSYFFFVFLIDAGKAALVLNLMPHEFWYSGILALVAGNIASIFMFFGGGKGVATLTGVLSVVSIPLLLLSFFAWLGALFMYRSVGCASVWALGMVILAVWYLPLDMQLSVSIGLSALVSLYKHRLYIQKMFFC